MLADTANPKMLQGGAAEHIGRELDTRLRDHLRQRSNLFAEGTGGLGASLSRPLLCLFERNFELSVVSRKQEAPSPAALLWSECASPSLNPSRPARLLLAHHCSSLLAPL